MKAHRREIKNRANATKRQKGRGREKGPGVLEQENGELAKSEETKFKKL